MVIVKHKINTDELAMYIDLVANKFKLTNDYNSIINKINEIFNVTVSLEQVENHFNPSASALEVDYYLQYKHLGLC